MNSTGSAVQLDPEELWEKAAQYHGAAVRVVERYGVHLGRYRDGVADRPAQNPPHPTLPSAFTFLANARLRAGAIEDAFERVESLFIDQIVEDAPVNHAREWRQRMICELAIGHDMAHFPFTHCHVIADYAPVTSPPKALRTHDRTAARRSQVA
jgi:hypothetical protein